MAQDSVTEHSAEVLELSRKYDLTQTLLPFLDRHLIVPILDFVSKSNLYDSKKIDQTKYDLLKDSLMTENVEALWKKIHPGEPVPTSVPKNKQQYEQKAEEYQQDLNVLSDTFDNEEVQNNLKQDKVQNLRLLEQHGVTVDKINSIYHLSQLKFSQGQYEPAAGMLNQFLLLSTNNSLNLSALWGKFACDLLTLDATAAVEDQQALREIVDQRGFSDPLTQLHNRAWIIHWSLFLLRNSNFNKEGLIDLFFSPSYISTIQASCPWIIRYISASVVSVYIKNRNSTSNERRLNDLVRVIGQEVYEYQDPITEFIRALYIDCDFAAAQSKLLEAETIMTFDFFLSDMKESFLKSARQLVSERYCRIHQRIDIKQLSAQLNLSLELGEKWIANLIKDTKMDAKINETENTIIMNYQPSSVYQQVIDNTKGLSFRSNQILTQSFNKNDLVVE